MSISIPETHWWKPVDREEKVWVTVALIWCIFITLMMPYWHFAGNQNPPWETYKIKPEQFEKLAADFIAKHKVGEDNGIPVVEPPAGDVFLVAKTWQFEPVLKLQKGQTYRLHVSSLDYQHGLSIFPINMNFMVLPDYDYVLTITPTESGDYRIICNEFCGIGHHNMVGKITVT